MDDLIVLAAERSGDVGSVHSKSPPDTSEDTVFNPKSAASSGYLSASLSPQGFFCTSSCEQADNAQTVLCSAFTQNQKFWY